MEVLIFKLCHIIDFNYAYEEIKKSLTDKFKNKGNDVLEKNLEVIEKVLENYQEVEITKKDIGEIEKEKMEMTIFEVLESRRLGNKIPVSAFVDNYDGMTPPMTANIERRYTSQIAPALYKRKLY